MNKRWIKHSLQQLMSRLEDAEYSARHGNSENAVHHISMAQEQVRAVIKEIGSQGTEQGEI